MREARDSSLPPLPFASLWEGRTFGPDPFLVSPDLVALYVDITGDDEPMYVDSDSARAAGFASPVVPPGLAGVWARRAYLGHHRMLPGGVMAGQRIELFHAAPVGRPLVIGAAVRTVDPADPRRRVLLDCSARTEDGEIVGEVHINARWPEGNA